MLASRYIPLGEPIDLINVAFENPRKMQAKASLKAGVPKKPLSAPGSSKKAKFLPLRNSGHIMTSTEKNGSYNETNIYMTPDRETGIEQLEELQRVCPGRIWNFVSRTRL